MGLFARLRRIVDRVGRTPAFAEEGWIRDWQRRRILRVETPDAARDAPTDGFEVLDAAATLPPPDADALDAPAGIERAVCVDDPRCCLYVRADGAVFPCSRLAEDEAAHPLGRLPADDPDAIWDGVDARAFREAFAQRSRARDDAFFQIIGGSRTLYERNLRLAAEALPPVPAPCEGCPRLGR